MGGHAASCFEFEEEFSSEVLLEGIWHSCRVEYRARASWDLWLPPHSLPWRFLPERAVAACPEDAMFIEDPVLRMALILPGGSLTSMVEMC